MLTFFIFTTFLLILATWILKHFYSRKKLYVIANKMHGPMAYPFIGNAGLFICRDEEILSKIYNVIEKFESPMRFWVGPELALITTKLNHIQRILSSPKFYHKHDLYRFVKSYLGNGLVSGSGPTYKKHRRIIQPLFNLKYCTNQIEIMQKYTDVCMKNLESYVDKGTFDIHLISHKCFVDIIGETILGTKMNIQKNGYTKFCKSAIDMYANGFTRLTRPWLHPDFIYKFTNNYKREKEIIKDIKDFLNTVIASSWQRRSLNNANISDVSPIIDQIGEYINQNPNSISNTDFISHMITLFAAAEDTMTIITSFVCLCLGMYPEYQNKAVEEVRQIFGTTPRTVTYEDIQKLEYLDMCIKDVERLCPIAPYILRQCLEDEEINESLKIPKGACVVVPIFNIHRNPELWKNPLHFYPDHFLPEAVSKRHVYGFVPFSAGPRGCIGKIFANVCLKTFLANFLQRFEVEADGKFPDVKLKMDISTRPIDGYKIRLKKRVWK
ncbi:unnamed protein product [Brassicogethes aeneus]|uniref:Cytochrome P450 n=1 Tax=Brassicogethes aeneus TaxID=1431903 RepID=A0A9P0FM03_BRAAE|nr:unnamed protein product [Brassicogethes aeneus]